MQTIRRAEALKKQTGHQFVPGIGYIAHPEEPLGPDGKRIPAHPNGNKNCTPPASTADKSMHVLRHAGGANHVMRWVAVEKAWSPLRPGDGNRMAWSIDYLSKHGWEYQRAATDEDVAPKEQADAAMPPKRRGS